MIEDSLSYNNGYQPDGNKVPPTAIDDSGGGNSDGIGVFKSCHEEAYRFGVANICPGTIIRGNVVWGNSDDGIDNSAADRVKIENNISFNNGPMGQKAFKIYNLITAGIRFGGNVAMLQQSHAFEPNIFGPGGEFFNNATINSQLKGFRFETGSAGRVYFANNMTWLCDGSPNIDFQGKRSNHCGD